MIKNKGAAFVVLILVIFAIAAPWFRWSEFNRGDNRNSHFKAEVTSHYNISDIVTVGGTEIVAFSRRTDKFFRRHNESISAFSSIFLALFTGLLFWKTWGLHQATRGLQDLAASQGDEMKKSIAEAARAASAMEGVADGIKETAAINKSLIESQRDFWSRQMRAYISVDTGGYIRQRMKVRFEFRPNITNNGMTPANNLKVWCRCELRDVVHSDFSFAIPEENRGPNKHNYNVPSTI
jgi:hypothetical protein